MASSDEAAPAATAGAAGIFAGDPVAVLGAGGTMGFPMARNLARAGIAVRAWDGAASDAAPLADDGAFVTDSAAEAVQGAGIVLTMLPGADAVLSVMEDRVLDVMRQADHENHPIWLQMGTIGEAATQRCIWLAGRYGVGFVDAPVLGGTDDAKRGELVIYESGPEEARPRIQPLFDVIGRVTIRVGQAGDGARLKSTAP